MNDFPEEGGDDLKELADGAKRGTVTLLYAARDESRNNAVVLKKIVEGFNRSASSAPEVA